MIEPDESDWKTARQLAAVSSWARQDVEAIATFIATAKAEERAAVVAFLHAEAQRMYEAGQDRPAWFVLENRAEAIERGEHRR